MALVSISEAIKLSGVSRPTFYRKHIGDKANKENRVSVEDVNGRRMIDTSELLRVFKVLHGISTQTVSNETPVHIETVDKNIIGNNKPDQSAEIEALKQQLQEAKEREGWYRQQIAEEKARAIEERARAEKAEIKLLEHLSPSGPPEPQESNPEMEGLFRKLSKPKRWYHFWK